jgi:hypothetical protein
MDKRVLDLVNDFSQWKGNPFTLANLIVELQKDLDREKLLAAGLPEAAEVI